MLNEIKSGAYFFRNDILLLTLLIISIFSFKVSISLPTVTLIILCGLITIGFGLNIESEDGVFYITFSYILETIIIFLKYIENIGFTNSDNGLPLSRNQFSYLPKQINLICLQSLLLLIALSSSVFLLRVIIYGSVSKKENINFYAGLTIGSSIIFTFLFNSISQEANNWSYFMAIGSFLILFFDYNIFVNAFSKLNNKKINSKYGKQLSLIVKKKFARIKLIISASTIFAVISVVIKKPLISLYNTIFNKNFHETPNLPDKFSLYFNIFLFIFYSTMILVITFYFIKRYKVSRIIKKSKIEDQGIKLIIWENTWSLKNALKRIPFLEEIVIFYEMISSDREIK